MQRPLCRGWKRDTEMQEEKMLHWTKSGSNDNKLHAEWNVQHTWRRLPRTPTNYQEFWCWDTNKKSDFISSPPNQTHQPFCPHQHPHQPKCHQCKLSHHQPCVLRKDFIYCCFYQERHQRKQKLSCWLPTTSTTAIDATNDMTGAGGSRWAGLWTFPLKHQVPLFFASCKMKHRTVSLVISHSINTVSAPIVYIMLSFAQKPHRGGRAGEEWNFSLYAQEKASTRNGDCSIEFGSRIAQIRPL